MKIVLILYLCSYVAGECLPPHQWDKEYRDMYDCMMAGYEESVNKMEEIGREEVNKYDMYIKFACIKQEDVNT